jgi:hypothetical protein
LEQLWMLSTDNITSTPNKNSVPIPVMINIGVQSGVCMSACNDDTTTACVYNSRDNLTWCNIPDQLNLRLSANAANVQDVVMPAPTATQTAGPSSSSLGPSSPSTLGTYKIAAC